MRLIRRYKRVCFSPLAIVLLARRFAPCLFSPSPLADRYTLGVGLVGSHDVAETLLL